MKLIFAIFVVLIGLVVWVGVLAAQGHKCDVDTIPFVMMAGKVPVIIPLPTGGK